MGKQLTEELKKQISELCQNSDMTKYEIAKTLDVSSRSVRRYKDYGYSQESDSLPDEYVDQSNVQSELYDQNVDNHQESETTNESDEPSEDSSIEHTEEPTCQGCGTPKSKWWTIDQALHYGWRTKETELWAWDYVCPKCGRPQSLKKCPGCGADISKFIKINETNVSEEQKQKYDFLCSICNEVFSVDDL